MRFNSVCLSSRGILVVASVLLFFSCTSEEQATRSGEAGAKNNNGIPTASVEGNLKLLTEGPISVEEGSSLENSDVMYLIPEVKDGELQRTLAVDVQPGTESGSSVDSLAKGEIVSSYLLHFDSEGGGETVLSGTITVPDPVVAVVTSGSKLDEGDEQLGASHVTYPEPDRGKMRSINLNQADEMSVSSDRRTINVTLHNWKGADQMRILTSYATRKH